MILKQYMHTAGYFFPIQVMKDRQRQMRDDLDLQVRTNNALKTLERNKERDLEYAQLVANKNELVDCLYLARELSILKQVEFKTVVPRK